jgi:hypothetical protein
MQCCTREPHQSHPYNQDGWHRVHEEPNAVIQYSMPERKATFCMTVRLDLKSRFRTTMYLPAHHDIVGRKELKIRTNSSCKAHRDVDPPSVVQHVETGMNVFAHRNLSRAPNGTRLSRRYVPQVPTQIAAPVHPCLLVRDDRTAPVRSRTTLNPTLFRFISKAGVCRMASLGSSEKYGSTFFRKSDLGQNLHQELQ